LYNNNQEPHIVNLRNVNFESNEVYATVIGVESAIGFSTGHSIYIDVAAGEIVSTFENVRFREHTGFTSEFCQMESNTDGYGCYVRGSGLPAPKAPAILYSSLPGV
jgi:hypothetical protein